MAIDHKEMSKWLFDKEQEFETLDEFKDLLAKKYVSREVAADDEDIRNKVTGKTLGALETKFKRSFGLTEDEVKGKKLSELFELAEAKNKTLIDDLQKQIKNADTPQELKELREQLDMAKRRATEQEDLSKSLTEKLAETEASSATRFQEYVTNMNVERVKNSIPWSDLANQYARRGFEMDIKEKYIFAMSDDKLIVTDKNGNQIKNDKGTGYLTAEELYRLEADKAGLIKKAGDAGGRATTSSVRTPSPEAPKRYAHPRLSGHLEALKQEK
jgi:hypothetical protein